MKKVCQNGSVLSESEACIPLSNRKFRYGDGFFETLVVEDKKIRYWEYHTQRIQRAFAVLGYDTIPEQKLENDITKLIDTADTNSALVNLFFSRKEGGLYTPESSQADYLITWKPISPLINSANNKRAGLSSLVRNYLTPWSFFKSDTLKYVIAGNEKLAHGWDEIILMDYSGYISECLSSNIFWVKDGVYYTPDMRTGCIEGIARTIWIDRLKSRGEKVETGFWKPEVLTNADRIFSTNVTGISEITFTLK